MPAPHVHVEAVPHTSARSRSWVEHLERSEMNRPTNEHDDTTGYEVRIQGHLDRRWMARFDGLSMRLEADGTTVISGPVPDQAALHGLLQRVRDMGLPLVSVVRMSSAKLTRPDRTGLDTKERDRPR
jgi:hypothetical protein